MHTASTSGTHSRDADEATRPAIDARWPPQSPPAAGAAVQTLWLVVPRRPGHAAGMVFFRSLKSAVWQLRTERSSAVDGAMFSLPLPLALLFVMSEELACAASLRYAAFLASAPRAPVLRPIPTSSAPRAAATNKADARTRAAATNKADARKKPQFTHFFALRIEPSFLGPAAEAVQARLVAAVAHWAGEMAARCRARTCPHGTLRVASCWPLREGEP